MCVSMIGVRESYFEKLYIFYTSHRYQEVQNLILTDWKNKNVAQNATKTFVQVRAEDNITIPHNDSHAQLTRAFTGISLHHFNHV